MLKVWERALELGLRRIPAEIADHAGYVPWHESWYRDFLAEYFAVGYRHLERGGYVDAYWVFSHLLELSPNDNLGARHYALDCCFHLGRHVAAVRICERYPDAYEGYLYFAKALAMWSTHTADLVEEHVARSVEAFPHFAKLIAQKRKRTAYPADIRHGITLHTPEEAQWYWNRQGPFWEATPDMVALVREQHEAAKRREYNRRRVKG